jgi:hypothetical protein
MKVALADVPWTAANKWLHPTCTRAWGFETDGRPAWSCHDIQAALTGRAPKYSFDTSQVGRAWDFVRALGCDCGPHRWPQRDEGLQGVRYMWLLLAMHVAEDEGIMVEVSK